MINLISGPPFMESGWVGKDPDPIPQYLVYVDPTDDTGYNYDRNTTMIKNQKGALPEVTKIKLKLTPMQGDSKQSRSRDEITRDPLPD